MKLSINSTIVLALFPCVSATSDLRGRELKNSKSSKQETDEGHDRQLKGAKKSSKKEEAEPTLLDITGTAEREGFLTFLSAIEAAGLEEAYTYETSFGSAPVGPFTVFAPTDAAFDGLNDISTALLPCLMEPDCAKFLEGILRHHVTMGGRSATAGFFDGESIPMQDGNEALMKVETDGTLSIDTLIDNTGRGTPSEVVQPDIVASNGYLHGID